MIPNFVSESRHKAVWGPKRHKAVWGPKQVVTAVAILVVGLSTNAFAEGRHAGRAAKVRTGSPNALAEKIEAQKLDSELSKRIRQYHRSTDTVDVIVIQKAGQDLPAGFRRYQHGDRLAIINGYALSGVPVDQVSALSVSGTTHRVVADRATHKHDALSSYSVLANAIDPTNNIKQTIYGYTGAGIRVAVVDSGFSATPQADLADSRVAFLNFSNDRINQRHDGNGHGTHVTGIVGATGVTSAGKYAGIAPGASILSLKVLDSTGQGSIADILQALNWIYTHPAANVKVVNMSVGAAVTESYWSDPLTLAAKALVDSGVTVVAAAGNFGLNNAGNPQWGGITSPGIAPWVLTVCAFSSQGTYNLTDDVVAGFSSAGPTAIDFGAKPDICAPGVGIVSLADAGSTLYSEGALAKPTWLLGDGATKPFESLSGTSMATPFVTGAVALMLQANPSLTPNLIKGILEYTATAKPDVSPLKQGAGFMDVAGAVSLAAAYRAGDVATNVSKFPNLTKDTRTVKAQARLTVKPRMKFVMPKTWGKHFVWGNHLMMHGVIDPHANAWKLGTLWGAAKTAKSTATDGDNIVWGTASDGDNIVWGTMSDGDNIVWGTASAGDNIVWGTASDGDNIVWGTASDGDNIVWGTDCGTADCNGHIWGSASDGDNIVWGTASAGDNIVWGTASDGDNIVWGTASDGDNIVWGTSAKDNVVWAASRKGGK